MKSPTVREYANQNRYSIGAVRRAIRSGYLKVEGKPMRVVGGEMPLTIRAWKEALKRASEGLPPSHFSFSTDPVKAHFLNGLAVMTVVYSADPQKLAYNVEQVLLIPRKARSAA